MDKIVSPRYNRDVLCKRCSKKNNDSQRFCSFCGAELANGKRQVLITRAEEQRREGDYQAAGVNLEKAKNLEPENHYLDLLLGLNCENLGDTVALGHAREHYASFLKADFANENVHQLLIGIYQKEGRLGEARKRYAGYLEVDQGNELLARCLKWIDITASVNVPRSAVSAQGDGGKHYRWLRSAANPMILALFGGTVELTVAGVNFILLQKDAGSHSDMLLHGVIGVVLWGIAGYFFFSRRTD